MTILLALVCLGLGITLAVFFFKNKKLTDQVSKAQAEIDTAKQDTTQVR